jgi:hypothetical protein
MAIFLTQFAGMAELRLPCLPDMMAPDACFGGKATNPPGGARRSVGHGWKGFSQKEVK